MNSITTTTATKSARFSTCQSHLEQQERNSSSPRVAWLLWLGSSRTEPKLSYVRIWCCRSTLCTHSRRHSFEFRFVHESSTRRRESSGASSDSSHVHVVLGKNYGNYENSKDLEKRLRRFTWALSRRQGTFFGPLIHRKKSRDRVDKDLKRVIPWRDNLLAKNNYSVKGIIISANGLTHLVFPFLLCYFDKKFH